MKIKTINLSFLILCVLSIFSCRTSSPQKAVSPTATIVQLMKNFQRLANDLKNAFALYLTDSASSTNNQNSALSAVAQKVAATNSNTIAQAMQDPNLDSTAANLSTTNSSSTSTSTASTTKTETQALIVGESLGNGLVIIAIVIAHIAYTTYNSVQDKKASFKQKRIKDEELRKMPHGDLFMPVIEKKFFNDETTLNDYNALVAEKREGEADDLYPKAKAFYDFAKLHYEVQEQLAKGGDLKQLYSQVEEKYKSRPDLLQAFRELYPPDLYQDRLTKEAQTAKDLGAIPLAIGVLGVLTPVAVYEGSSLGLVNTKSPTPDLATKKLLSRLQNIQNQLTQLRAQLKI